MCAMNPFDRVIFDFLNSWFAGAGDFDGGGTTVQDIFAFLNAWFLGC